MMMETSKRIRVAPEFAETLDKFTDAINAALPDTQQLSVVEGSKILNSLIGQSGVIVLKKPKGRQKLLDMAALEDIYL